MLPIDSHLNEISADLKAAKPVAAVRVRSLLDWFGIKRRGFSKVLEIRHSLKKAGLVTVPDFESAFIDSEVSFQLFPLPELPANETPPEDMGGEEDPISGVVSGGVIADPTYRIGKLSAANQPLDSVKPDSTLEAATTLMMSKDYSQIPVMQSEFTVKGVISWESIGKRNSLQKPGALVRDYTVPATMVSTEDSLFSVISLIVEHQYVLVQNKQTGKVTGIVTTSDLSLQFRQLGEPFLLLGEIENHIRFLIDGVYTPDELKRSSDPSDTERVVVTVADLSFGEYLRLLQQPANWAKLGIPIDRAEFVKRLDEIRKIRNDVMHFDPDPMEDGTLIALRNFALFMQDITMSRRR
jgi:CBS domain-containing protein